MTSRPKTIETHTSSFAHTSCRVDVQDDGEVMVEIGDGTWINCRDLAEMCRFIEKHGDVDLRSL